eukprot:PhF_6_TR37997/c0_g1_i1/m.56741
MSTSQDAHDFEGDEGFHILQETIQSYGFPYTGNERIHSYRHRLCQRVQHRAWPRPNQYRCNVCGFRGCTQWEDITPKHHHHPKGGHNGNTSNNGEGGVLAARNGPATAPM